MENIFRRRAIQPRCTALHADALTAELRRRVDLARKKLTYIFTYYVLTLQ